MGDLVDPRRSVTILSLVFLAMSGLIFAVVPRFTWRDFFLFGVGPQMFLWSAWLVGRRPWRRRVTWAEVERRRAIPAGEWTAYAKNAPGPFYVLDGCCTNCGVPTAIAPELFEFDSRQCYLKRQPESDDEWEKALRVLVWGQDLNCIRYRGTDAAVLRRVAEAGHADLTDHAPPPGVRTVLRNLVTFTAMDREQWPPGGQALLEAFATHERSAVSYVPIRTTAISTQGDQASFSVAWYEDHFHPVTVRRGSGSNQWLIRHGGNLGLSVMLDEWLRSDARFSDVRWHTEAAGRESRDWQPRPW